jgi:hypothetical protein
MVAVYQITPEGIERRFGKWKKWNMAQKEK